MFWKVILGLLGLAIVFGIIAVALYQPLNKPWHSRWGATGSEVAMALPGDDIVVGEVVQTTRAISIHTPAVQVWPWLVQLGQGRGGMYSYDFLENLLGCDIHTLDAIVPALQNLQVGDAIMMGPQENLPYYQVVLLEPNRALVLQSIQRTTGAPGETWGFYLNQESSSLTRLVVRHRTPPSLKPNERIFNAIFDPIVFVMEHRMLRGIRDHAEQISASVSMLQ